MSKPLQWFRLYAEAVDDEKLRLLAFQDRWHYIAILCCKAAGILDGEDADLRRRKVAIKLGLDPTELAELARRLASVDLICEETFQPLAWNRRQFVSDHDPTAPGRLKKFREKRRIERETEMQRVAQRTCNANETPSETETETETEKRWVSTNVDTSSSPSADDPQKPARYSVPDCPYAELVSLYHEFMPIAPRVEVLSEQRKRHLQARWRQVCADEKLDRASGLKWFRDFFDHAGHSPFLCGKVKPKDGRRPFIASLDWLMGAEKFVLVVEGRYHQ